MHRGRKCGRVNRVSGTWIYHYPMALYYFIGMIPTREDSPIVSPDNKRKLTFGIGGLQSIERMYHVRRAGKMELKIRSAEFGIICDGKLH